MHDLEALFIVLFGLGAIIGLAALGAFVMTAALPSVDFATAFAILIGIGFLIPLSN